jgi:hypothetical protein
MSPQKRNAFPTSSAPNTVVVTRAELGPIDVSVNNAMATVFAPVLEIVAGAVAWIAARRA